MSKDSAYKLPTNSEEGIDLENYIYQTKEFPLWKLCLNQANHPNNYSVLYNDNACPLCGTVVGERKREAIRFVTACSDGHLDEVNWNYIVHRGNNCARTQIPNIQNSLTNENSFYWDQSGGTLGSIEIRCPRCDMVQNFADAYYRPLLCKGRNPETESIQSTQPRYNGCDKEARILQRQAANLRIAEVRTLLSIQESYTTLHRNFQNSFIRQEIQAYETYTKENLDSMEKLKSILTNLVNRKNIQPAIANQIIKSKWEDIEAVLNDLKQPYPTSYYGLIQREFSELIKGSINGIPPQNSNTGTGTICEMNKYLKKNFASSNGIKYSVSPLTKLRTVTVQTGFVRDIRQTDPNIRPRPVPVSFADLRNMHQLWYPGVEFLGEGIFIRRDENDGWYTAPAGNHAEKWMNALTKADDYSRFVFRDAANSTDELDPAFVWWHTFSHLLIRAIGEDSGYSSASIRERIYIERDGSRVRGGILLYATQPGTEGTMGGLIALAPFFDRYIRLAIEQLKHVPEIHYAYAKDFQVENMMGQHVMVA